MRATIHEGDHPPRGEPPTRDSGCAPDRTGSTTTTSQRARRWGSSCGASSPGAPWGCERAARFAWRFRPASNFHTMQSWPYMYWCSILGIKTVEHLLNDHHTQVRNDRRHPRQPPATRPQLRCGVR
jgi:hypothetical protein